MGQIVGLPTLNAILTKFNIGSNKHQKDYKSLCKDLSVNVIRKLFEHIFELHIVEVLKQMGLKESSCWSKDLVTVILDDSIFRQWLDNQSATADFERYYGLFFSGQYGAAVYGFKVVCLGVCIDGVMYPLYFDFVKKTAKTAKVEKVAKTAKVVAPSIEIAIKLVQRFGNLRKKLANEGLKFPKFHFSCDSGYNERTLGSTCEANDLIYISVPKKPHLFEIDSVKRKLSDWIEKDFIQAEKKHQEKEKDLPEKEKTPFTLRIKAKYCSQENKDVILLAFRLNHSNKISVIYCTDKHIFAKTLRRHWFERTYIEQFFKMLKHVLKIQNANVQNKDDFEIKLLRFAFVAWHAQKLVRFLRTKMKEFHTKGFIALQRILNSDKQFLDLLQSLI